MEGYVFGWVYFNCFGSDNKLNIISLVGFVMGLVGLNSVSLCSSFVISESNLWSAILPFRKFEK